MANLSMSLAIIGSLILVSACTNGHGIAYGIRGSGKVVSETRKLSNYHSLALSVPAEVVVEVGNPGDLSIEADDNLLPHIITEVKDGSLEIRTDTSFNNTKKIVIKAKTAKLDQLAVSGASNIIVNGLSGDKFGVEASGASSITAIGTVKAFSAELSGATSLKAVDLNAQSAHVSISGAGIAEIDAENDLNASISGAGRIKYKGSPKITKQLSGIGSIQQL